MRTLIPLLLVLLVICASSAQDKPQAKPDTTVTIDLKKLDQILGSIQKDLNKETATLNQAFEDPSRFLREAIQQQKDKILFLQTRLQLVKAIKADTTIQVRKE